MHRDRLFLPFLIILMMSYAAGITGFLTLDWFPALTPFNLLMCFAALWYYQEANSPRSFRFFLLGIFVYTWIIECIGVNTGVLFGHYRYDWALGPKLAGTPLMIGINWLVLALAIGAVVQGLKLSRVLKTILASAAMSLTDVLIEPMAIEYGLWTWMHPEVPLQNYLMWFLVSLPVFWFYFQPSITGKNRMAPWIWGLQVIFFLAVTLF